MVLGLRSKSRKSHSVYVDYQILVKEIKPWPLPLASAQSIRMQWENGDSSGSLMADVTDDKLEFNEFFTLSVTFNQEESKKGNDHERLQKNNLEFTIYKIKKEKPKPIGSAVINLADYGIITESMTVSAPVNLKKNYKNALQPVLYVNIQSVEHDGGGSSPKTSFSKFSPSNGGSGSASVASFTDDDDISSHSSRRVSFSASETSRSSTSQNHKQSKSMYKALSLAPNHVNDSLGVVSSDIQGHMNFGSSRFEVENGRRARTFNKHSADEATLVSEIERLLREEEKMRQRSSGNITLESFLHTQKDEKKTSKDNGVEDLLEGKSHSFERKAGPGLLEDAAKKQLKLRTNTLTLSRKPTFGIHGGNKLKHLNSVQFHFDSGESKKAEKGVSHGKGTSESRVEMLEEELREAAALEASIYSVVAEHGSSVNKVHAPSRRLSRFYLHACKASSESRRASAAKAAVSGLIRVSKACGNDVPRLTFWLTNSTALRGMISQGIRKLNIPSGTCTSTNGGGKQKLSKKESSDEWEDPSIFLAALEKFEAWLFSRIVKSVWWQALTPHMQPTATRRSSSKKSTGKKPSVSSQNQGLVSIELWKKALKDACERLCPLRAKGHECGCLPVLMKLVLEQLVNRLDVAMFNAILRESATEMPTDPVSDPISDPNVLPIPAGKASFGAGAQLKNSIGNWSRWLTDMFDVDNGGTPDQKDETNGENTMEPGTSSRAFHLLNALSDLMMLPFGMLADRSTRKEVCPMFGAQIVKRVLKNFVPDEFNPGRIPKGIFEALDSEDLTHANDGCVTSFPCLVSPTFYSPPPVSLVTSFIGDVGSRPLLRSGSIMVRKSYTSDDELDELDSPLTSILIDSSRASSVSKAPKAKGGQKVVRYQLLREVWRDSEQ